MSRKIVLTNIHVLQNAWFLLRESIVVSPPVKFTFLFVPLFLFKSSVDTFMKDSRWKLVTHAL